MKPDTAICGIWKAYFFSETTNLIIPFTPSRLWELNSVLGIWKILFLDQSDIAKNKNEIL